MANHKSAKKRARQDFKKRLANRYVKKTTRSAIQRLREIEDKKDAETFLPKVIKLIDGLVKRNIWHKNKGANLKSKLTKHVNSIG
jgi:small subunit ribosomal protein S20